MVSTAAAIAACATRVMAQTATPRQAVPAAQLAPWVSLVGALAWPLAAIVMTLAFRKPLGEFLRALAPRITKVSAFKVELQLAEISAPAASLLLDDIKDANVIPAAISDSTRMMLEQAQSTEPADFIAINIGEGGEWLTSRLYIAATLLQRMRQVKAVVFLESTAQSRRRFVAVAPLELVRWRLARAYPWLEAAWARAYLSVFPAWGPLPLPSGAGWLVDPVTASIQVPRPELPDGALEPLAARQVVGQFISLLQRGPTPAAVQPAAAGGAAGAPAAAAPAAAMAPIQPSVKFASGVEERASWITRSLLEKLLPDATFRHWVEDPVDSPRIVGTRRILRREAAFVALVDKNREFVRLVNRSMLMEQLAASASDETEAEKS
jgi:hypothetical protein